MPNKLKPCPFCGTSENILQSVERGYYVFCIKCKVHGPITPMIFTSIEAWNRRAYDPEECKNCKREKHLVGITRAEAVERMAKALLLKMFKGIVDWEKLDDKEKVRWRKSAEAALAALLEEVR